MIEQANKAIAKYFISLKRYSFLPKLKRRFSPCPVPLPLILKTVKNDNFVDPPAVASASVKISLFFSLSSLFEIMRTDRYGSRTRPGSLFFSLFLLFWKSRKSPCLRRFLNAQGTQKTGNGLVSARRQKLKKPHATEDPQHKAWHTIFNFSSLLFTWPDAQRKCHFEDQGECNGTPCYHSYSTVAGGLGV